MKIFGWSPLTRIQQYICAGIVTLLSAADYMHAAWTYPTILLLILPNSPIGVRLTADEISWVIWGRPIGLLLGSVPAGILMEKIGRKKTLLLAGLLFIISWIIIVFSESFAMLIIARIVAGFAGSLVTGVLSIYIGEISDDDIRGRLCSATSIGGLIGLIIVWSVRRLVSFTTLAWICAALPALFFVLFLAMPESPYYLVKTNQERRAHEILLRLNKTNADDKLKEIQTHIQQDELAGGGVKHLLRQRNFRISVGTMLAVKTLQHFSGMFSFNNYLQNTLTSSPTETLLAMMAVIQIPCVIISAYLVDKKGRRSLLMKTGGLSFVVLIAEGIYFIVKEQKVYVSGDSYLRSIFLTEYFIRTMLGFGILPYVLAGEVFASNTKQLGAILFAFFSGLIMFFNLKFFNWVADIGSPGAFFLVSVVLCLIVLFRGLCYLPDTKGKSFREIQMSFP